MSSFVVRRRWISAGFLGMAILYYGLISLISHIPGHQLLPVVGPSDKLIHFLEYAPLGFLITGWLVLTHSHARRRFQVLAAALAVVVLGSADEVHQMFVDGRDASVADVLADSFGGIVGSLIAVVFIRWPSRTT